ncbi:uncharacterized protein [Dermacentor andersoni]|uniref:uncharacterized protein n=1 Tax=Dermacentor andersoni TaxID=34620 RepID=UPI003B3B9CDE
MPATFSAGVVTFFLLASLTACCCKGTQEESLLAKVEHADTDNVTTAGVAGAVTTPEPRNDTRIEVTSQANSVRGGSASVPKVSSSGWDTVYKLLYETFSYPEAKELEALLPLPSTYLTRKQRRDRKDDGRKKEQQHATRELTYRTVGNDDGSGDHPSDPKDGGAYDEGGDPGSSESSSQSEEEEEVEEARESGDPYDEDDDDDDSEMADDVVKQKTASSSTAAPSSSKTHRRTERSVPATGTLLPPPRPWRERGKDFGLPVPEDRWSKHVAAKRREAQLIRRSLQDQLRMKALQWRQKENHFRQRYKPAVATGTI